MWSVCLGVCVSVTLALRQGGQEGGSRWWGVSLGVICSDRVAPLGHCAFLSFGFLL